MNVVSNPRAAPWYREPWPWILMALPALAVVGCSITLWLALRSADGVVATDYYKRGLAINTELARADRAEQLGLKAEVELAGFGTGDRVLIRLTAERPLPAETALRFSLVHPGRDVADRVALLARASAEPDRAEYVGYFGEQAPLAQPVAWQVEIESPTWRLDGRISAQEGRVFRLQAGQ